MTETLEISGLLFEVRRSDRRKTLGLTVDRGGELIAHTPLATSAEAIIGVIAGGSGTLFGPLIGADDRG